PRRGEHALGPRARLRWDGRGGAPPVLIVGNGVVREPDAHLFRCGPSTPPMFGPRVLLGLLRSHRRDRYRRRRPHGLRLQVRGDGERTEVTVCTDLVRWG